MIRFIGVCCFLLAIFGFWYLGNTIHVLNDHSFTSEYPYLKLSYAIMAGVNALFFAALCILGGTLFMQKKAYTKWLVGLIAIEIIYMSLVGASWGYLEPEYSSSVAAATGIANGGMMIQAISGFVLWGPLILWYSGR